MPLSSAYRADPRFPELGPEFADQVRPAEFPQAILRYRNDRAAATVGLDSLSDAEWVGHFGRFEPLPDNIAPPLAQRYHGHQFRVYNPELGDGRLTLKGGVREVLATAMLEALGVPTSRSFSLIETGEALVRSDEPSPTRASVLVRLSHGHIRFGTFQRQAFFENGAAISALIDHVIAHYYPQLSRANDKAAALLGEVVKKMARLTARWMAAGFVHGVLNTDNMSITGESFDYGPYRFLPRNDPNFVAAYFDSAGLYSFGRQPEAVFWNLQQLAGTLTLVTASEPLVEALNAFGAAYRRELMAAMLDRLGLKARGEAEDAAFVQAVFRAIAEGGEPLRWEPFFFDWFCGDEARALGGPRGELYATQGFEAFRRLLTGYEPDRPGRLGHPYFARREPEELLYDEIEAIWASIAESDDWSRLAAKLAAIDAARRAWGLPGQQAGF